MSVLVSFQYYFILRHVKLYHYINLKKNVKLVAELQAVIEFPKDSDVLLKIKYNNGR